MSLKRHGTACRFGPTLLAIGNVVHEEGCTGSCPPKRRVTWKAALLGSDKDCRRFCGLGERLHSHLMQNPAWDWPLFSACQCLYVSLLTGVLATGC